MFNIEIKSLLLLFVSVLCLWSSANATDRKFIHPSTWGIPEDDHYNTYIEDREHPCSKGSNYNESQCSNKNELTPDGYVLRDCGYGGQCSHPEIEWQHAGIDYDFPFHKHDPEDYDENGVRKETSLRQGRGTKENFYHGVPDDIVASNNGYVVFVEEDFKQTHGFGRVVILRHSLDPSDLSSDQKVKLCESDNKGNLKCEIFSKYAHMASIEEDIVKGKRIYIYRGQKIGKIGGSAKSGDGAWIHHLHFELTKKPDSKDQLRAPLCNDYGYVDKFPDECGYVNPNDVIGKFSCLDPNYADLGFLSWEQVDRFTTIMEMCTIFRTNEELLTALEETVGDIKDFRERVANSPLKPDAIIKFIDAAIDQKICGLESGKRSDRRSISSCYTPVIPDFSDLNGGTTTNPGGGSSDSGNGNSDSGFTCDNVTDGFQASIGSTFNGECVPYVRYETGIEYACCNTAAKYCYDQAYDCGYDVGSKAELGSIAVFNSWKNNPYGHVGIVIGIDAKNNKIKLRHSNWHRKDNKPLVTEDWVSLNAYPLKGYVYCDGDSLGSGSSTLPTEPPASGRLPDFITDKVTMGNKDGNHEKYTWKINETAYVHAWIDNIGDADWEGTAKEIKVPFYLSKGTKEDSHSEWIRVDRETIKKEHIKVKDKPKHESIEFDLLDWANEGKVLPGRTYNFVVCADRPKDENNGDGDVREKHKSNNCSTEAVFYVDFGPPRNVDLTTRMLALTNGKTSLRAGENYGLQVEISNLGTEPPWNGFRTSYEIKGPGTGDQWQIITDDGSDANQLYPGAAQTEHITDGFGAKAPMVGGDYLFRACADYTKAVPETDENNNCTELAVYIAPPPMPDLITHSLRLTNGRTELYGGELYGLEVGIQNIGEIAPGSGFRSSYEIKGPGTGDAWVVVADDGSDADELAPGATHWEHITDG